MAAPTVAAPAGQSARRLPIPTGRLAAVAGLAAVVPLLSPRPGAGLLLVNGLLAAACALDVARAPDPRRVRVSRQVPAVLTLHQDASVRYEVEVAAGSRRGVVAVADAIPAGLGPVRRRLRYDLRPAVRAGASAGIRPTRRGDHAWARLVVRTCGPWGLVARQANHDVPATVRVLPEFRSRAEAERRVARARLDELGLRLTRGRGAGTDFEALREYTPDDEFRHIDWAATARAHRPVVRTYRAERNQTVLLLVDSGRLSAGVLGDVPRLEHALDAALALTHVATRLGDRVGLVTFADGLRSVVRPGTRRDQLQRVVNGLYALQPRLVESDYAGALAATLAGHRRRALLVILSELAASAVRVGLLPAVGLAARRHVVMVAAVQDPAVASWAQGPPRTAGEAYRGAAAADALAARENTAALLRSRGAIVVDAIPGRLPGALADAYLRLKAAGAL